MNPSSPERFVRAKSTQVGRRTPPYRPHMVPHGFTWRPGRFNFCDLCLIVHELGLVCALHKFAFELS